MKNTLFKFLPILILTILSDVVCNNSMIEVFNMQSLFNPLGLTILMLCIQMLAAPIQAGFSDFYYRRIGLIVALSASFLSLFFLCFMQFSGIWPVVLLFVGLLLNSCLGNTAPIAWAALADIQAKNLRFHLALTTSAYAIGYMILAILSKSIPYSTSELWLWQYIIIPLILIGICIAFVYRFYQDSKDRDPHPSHSQKPSIKQLSLSELSSLSKELRSSSTRSGLLAYFCWALSQYNALLFLLESVDHCMTIVIMMLGYLAGVAILGLYRRIPDEKMIKVGFLITIIAMAMYLISYNHTAKKDGLLSFCYFFYTLSNAFLSASIFSLFSKERKVHEQGKGFGLIISADSAGFLIAIISITVFKYLNFNLEYITLYSFIIFALSWLPFSAYEKARKNANRVT